MRRNPDAQCGGCRKIILPSNHVRMIIFTGIFFLSWFWERLFITFWVNLARTLAKVLRTWECISCTVDEGSRTTNGYLEEQLVRNTNLACLWGDRPALPNCISHLSLWRQENYKVPDHRASHNVLCPSFYSISTKELLEFVNKWKREILNCLTKQITQNS